MFPINSPVSQQQGNNNNIKWLFIMLSFISLCGIALLGINKATDLFVNKF